MADYDIIIVGSGAGGGTLAYSLAGSGKRILIIERGGFLPREPENWIPAEVFGGARYKNTELWLDRWDAGHLPGMHYFVGGNTKMFGAALPRLRREDFGELRLLDGVSPAWPITYDEMAPHYSQAEILYKVHGKAGEDPTDPRGSEPYPYPAIEHAPEIEELAEKLRRKGLHPFHLPLGLDFHQAGLCKLTKHCDGFPCQVGAKSDAEVCAVRPALDDKNVELICIAKVERIIATSDGKRVACVEAQVNGKTERFKAEVFVLSCGAVNSAALLLRSAIGNSSGLAGCYYMAHLNGTVMSIRLTAKRRETVFQKTLALNDFYFAGRKNRNPLGNLQLIGKVQSDMMRSGLPGWAWPRPNWALEFASGRSLDWWVLSEDLPLKENCVELTRNGQIKLNVRWTNRKSHRELVKRLCALMDFECCVHRIWDAERIGSCSHQVGTLRFGEDPKTSVLNEWCRSHDLENLFVVDGSFFPSSAAVNPALTIIAQALRVGNHIRERFGVGPKQALKRPTFETSNPTLI